MHNTSMLWRQFTAKSKLHRKQNLFSFYLFVTSITYRLAAAEKATIIHATYFMIIIIISYYYYILHQLKDVHKLTKNLKNTPKQA